MDVLYKRSLYMVAPNGRMPMTGAAVPRPEACPCAKQEARELRALRGLRGLRGLVGHWRFLGCSHHQPIRVFMVTPEDIRSYATPPLLPTCVLYTSSTESMAPQARSL